jgi:hypothetical protein
MSSMTTMTNTTTPTKQSQTTTATMKFKSPRASLQLTHRLGGYIRRMHLRAPTGNTKNNTNTKPNQLSLSATPLLPHRLEGYQRGPRLGPPLNGKMISLNTR